MFFFCFTPLSPPWGTVNRNPTHLRLYNPPAHHDSSSWFSKTSSPKPPWLVTPVSVCMCMCVYVCVWRRGLRRTQLQLHPPASNYVQWNLASSLQASQTTPTPALRFSSSQSPKSSQTINEFWFFSFSSSLICCLRNSILQEEEGGAGRRESSG